MSATQPCACDQSLALQRRVTELEQREETLRELLNKARSDAQWPKRLDAIQVISRIEVFLDGESVDV